MATERGPGQSKKFLMVILTELSWTLCIGAGLWILKDQVAAGSAWLWWWMIAATVVKGFVEVGYIGGQSWLDRYVKVAELAAKGAPRKDEEGK